MSKVKAKNSYLNHLLRNQLTSLILYEKIQTTLKNAKALKPLAEKILSLSAKNNLSAQREVLRYVFDKSAAKKLFVSIAPKIKNNSNKIQVFKLARRLGDNAQLAIIRFHPDIQTIEFNEKAKTKKSE